VLVEPPRPVLDSTELLEYTQLGHFAFLKDSRYNVNQQPWALRLGREAMDAHFKLCRAPEEITRVTAEACRLATWMIDEEEFVNSVVNRLTQSNPALAIPLRRRLRFLVSMNSIHRHRLAKLQCHPDFKGNISSGIRKGSMQVVSQEGESLNVDDTIEEETAYVEEEEELPDEAIEEINLTIDALELCD